jgi:hypothetical protein
MASIGRTGTPSGMRTNSILVIRVASCGINGGARTLPRMAGDMNV